MVAFLNLIRWKNLLIMLLTVFAFKYWVFHAYINHKGFYNFTSVFSFFDTLLLALSIVLIAAAGYVINDVLDIESDEINKPEHQIIGSHISINKAYQIYIALNVVGIGIGIYLALQIGVYQLAIFHVACASLLWLYSMHFKSSVLIGNIIVALLSALVPITYFCFEAFSYIKEYGLIFLNSFGGYFKADPLQPLLWFTVILSFFAFIFSVIREIIKDLQDRKGDEKLEGKTLPLAIGEQKTLWIVRVLLILSIGAMIYTYYGKVYFTPQSHLLFHAYFYLALIAPSFLLLKELFQKSIDYAKAGNLVKLILLFGVLSTFISFILLK